MDWITIERPGYFGKKRDEVYAGWDEKYGKGNWQLMWAWGKFILPKLEAYQIYEDSYYEFFKREPGKLEWLINTASDIYDTAPSNVEAPFNYEHQETPSTHLHDVSIRRSLRRLGVWFKGDHLMQVRWIGSEGFDINPGVIPFHRPEKIYRGEIKDYTGGKSFWWKEGSLEDWYQKAKVLQVLEKILMGNKPDS
jgi:hypothetical protein